MVIGFLLSIVVQHRPRPMERFVNSICWYVGVIAVLAAQAQDATRPIHSLLVGVGAAVLCFLIIVFVEEIYWSGKHLKTSE